MCALTLEYHSRSQKERGSEPDIITYSQHNCRRRPTCTSITQCFRVGTDPGKSMNFKITFSSPGKSRNLCT